MRKPAQPKQIMKAPDMFRKSFQSFDKKTGERISYGWRDFAESLPIIVEPEPIPNQLNLF